jgi:hypothetical protein
VLPVLVHNQSSDFELVSPTYFGRDVIWYTSPDQKVDADAVIRTSFGKDAARKEFTSALIYKLQRKKHLESNANNTSTEDTSTSLQLLVIWGPITRYSFSVRALLIKHSITVTWNEDTLERLYSMHFALLKDNDIVKDTWLLDDATRLMTTSEWKGENCAIKITISKISEENIEDTSMAPLWVSSTM